MVPEHVIVGFYTIRKPNIRYLSYTCGIVSVNEDVLAAVFLFIYLLLGKMGKMQAR